MESPFATADEADDSYQALGVGRSVPWQLLPPKLGLVNAATRDARSQCARPIMGSEAGATMGTLVTYLWIAIGGALGSVARFWCSGVAARLVGETFPWGTIVVNVTGSFVIGFAATSMGPDGRLFVGSTARQFIMVGICGGYTTFSSFSLQTLDLLNDGEWLPAIGNVGLSVVLCLLAVWAGHVLAVNLNAMKWI
jgi:CrcB protein